MLCANAECLCSALPAVRIVLQSAQRVLATFTSWDLDGSGTLIHLCHTFTAESHVCLRCSACVCCRAHSACWPCSRPKLGWQQQPQSLNDWGCGCQPSLGKVRLICTLLDDVCQCCTPTLCAIAVYQCSALPAFCILQSAQRVLATFTSWDLDGSSTLSRQEFSAISQVRKNSTAQWYSLTTVLRHFVLGGLQSGVWCSHYSSSLVHKAGTSAINGTCIPVSDHILHAPICTCKHLQYKSHLHC
jgi:hypothetical protein